jgi:hypothetical protein
VEWIRDQRARQRIGCTGELRQHEHARSLGILRGDELLGDQVHAVAQRRHERDVGEPIELRQHVLVVGSIEVANWHPVGVAEAAIDPADQPLHALAQLGVIGNLRTRRNRDLQKCDAATPFRAAIEQPLKRLEALGDALGVVEPIDA